MNAPFHCFACVLTHTGFQQVTVQLKETIQESQEEKEHLQQQLDKVSQQFVVAQKGKLTL